MMNEPMRFAIEVAGGEVMFQSFNEMHATVREFHQTYRRNDVFGLRIDD
jgi:hypothetical protein